MMLDSNKIQRVVRKLLEALEKLSSSEATLRNEAFKVIFAFFAFKRFSDAKLLKVSEQGNWDILASQPPDQLFKQLELSFERLQIVNVLPDIASELKLGQLNDRVSRNTKEYLLTFFSRLDLSQAKYSTPEVNAIVADFVQRCVYQHHPETLENKSLNRLAIALLAPREDEKLFFPQCGLGDIIMQAADYYEENKSVPLYSNDGYAYVEPEEFLLQACIGNSDIWPVVVLRTLLAEIKGVTVRNEDYFLYPVTFKKRLSKLEKLGKDIKIIEDDVVDGELRRITNSLFDKYNSLTDLLRSLPYLADVSFFAGPFGRRLHDDIPTTISIKDHSFEIPRNHSELFALVSLLKQLYKKGRTGIVLPSSALSRETDVYKKLREFLVEEDLLEAIVQLPPSIFPFTRVSLVLLIINAEKQKEKKNKFAFITVKASRKGNTISITEDSINKAIYVYRNFTSLSNDHIASLEEIQQQDYNLLPSRYMGAIAEEIKIIRKSQTGRQLGEICKLVQGTSTGESGNMDGIPVISTRNLSKDIKDLYINLDDVSCTHPELFAESIKQKCIVVSLVGNELKPTIFDPGTINNCSEILMGKNVAAIFPDDSIVDFEYLYYQLNSSLIKTQIEENVASAGIPNISLARLKQIIIPVPGKIEQQKSLAYQNKMELLKAEKAKYEALAERLQISDEKRDDEFRMVSMLRHNLNRRIGNVEAIMTNLQNFIQRKGLNDDALQEKYFEGQGEIVVKDVVAEALIDLKQMHRLMEETRKFVAMSKSLKDEDKQVIDIGELFDKQILAKYKNHKVKISITCPGGVKVLLHESSFIEAIDNIINNAEEHAFNKSNEEDEIYFWIRDLGDRIVIDYANNGMPFPADMSEDDFLKFGIKGRASNGTGLGGAYVKLMLDAHSASFEIINRDKAFWSIDKAGDMAVKEDKAYSKYGTYFRITIPNRRGNEQ